MVVEEVEINNLDLSTAVLSDEDWETFLADIGEESKESYDKKIQSIKTLLGKRWGTGKTKKSQDKEYLFHINTLVLRVI